MSTLKVNTIQNASGVEVYTAKAWVNFNGTGTVAIRASGNVSSITDNGTGDYTVNFTTAMPDANYATLVCGEYGSGANGDVYRLKQGASVPYTTTSVRVESFNVISAAYEDSRTLTVAIHR